MRTTGEIDQMKSVEKILQKYFVILPGGWEPGKQPTKKTRIQTSSLLLDCEQNAPFFSDAIAGYIFGDDFNINFLTSNFWRNFFYHLKKIRAKSSKSNINIICGHFSLNSIIQIGITYA